MSIYNIPRYKYKGYRALGFRESTLIQELKPWIGFIHHLSTNGKNGKQSNNGHNNQVKKEVQYVI